MPPPSTPTAGTTFRAKLLTTHIPFSPFMFGARSCIGQAFTKTEYKVLLMSVVSRFRFEKVEIRGIGKVNPSPVLRPEGGLRVRILKL
jgi:cytochrome P450